MPSSDIVLFGHGRHIVGTGSVGRIRLAILEGGQGIQLLFDNIYPGVHALHL
jgi:hypothetical protein